MFNDDTPQHAEEEGTYTPREVIRKDFDLLWEAITAEICKDWSLSDIADEIITARLRLYERAGLLRSSNPMTTLARQQLNSLGSVGSGSNGGASATRGDWVKL